MIAPAQDSGVGILDDAVLDEFTIPFGSWIEEAVNWITLNMSGVLDAIAWPFEFLLENLVDRFLIAIPWLFVVAITFLVAWLVRNLTVAFGSAGALVVCGLLGNEFWVQTARTIGFILVAVIVCIVIGIPLGVLSGRFDSVWSIMRPTLDAMQVIHSFVYLLPFVYFWGVGRVSATMATMVFALPPLIRLTNLGIRQVPEDVVEASRAYGANELRVLRDVQLPLARPAIMTGINQTLLLAFSMLGIAAILGAGGMGALLFRALGQQDVNLAAAAGLGFFLLAVILDRISQTQAGGSGLFSRMTTAWRARRQPEVLLVNPDFNAAVVNTAVDDANEGQRAPMSTVERAMMGVSVVGALGVLVSMLMSWSVDGSLVTGYTRRDDAGLVGSFSALSAEGGSWFALVVLGASVSVIVSVAGAWLGRSTSRHFSPDSAAVAAVVSVLTVLAYVAGQPSALVPDYSVGAGAYLALASAVVAMAGSLAWLVVGPYGPRRPLKQRVAIGPLVLASVAVAIAVISTVSMWQLDERGGVVITPAIEAEIDEVKRLAEAGEMDPGVAATEIQVIRAKAKVSERIVLDGLSSEGVGLGGWTLAMTLAGAIGSLGVAGLFGFDERRRWLAGTVALGAGAGVVAVGVAFVGGFARATDRNYFSGVGVMLVMVAGVMLVASSRGLIRGFSRLRVYDDAGDAS